MRPSAEGKSLPEPVIPHEGGMDVRLAEASSDSGASILEETDAAGLYILGGGSEGSSNGLSNIGSFNGWTKGYRDIVVRSLEMDMPVMAMGDGLFLLNEVFGGEPPVMAATTIADKRTRPDKQGRRTIYVSPGSKTAAILGAGGFFRFRGEADLPRLMDSHRSSRLLASAYAVEDGAVEGLESAEHSWVIGFRADLTRQERLPRGFGGIFQSFVEKAQDFSLARTGT